MAAGGAQTPAKVSRGSSRSSPTSTSSARQKKFHRHFSQVETQLSGTFVFLGSIIIRYEIVREELRENAPQTLLFPTVTQLA